MKMDLGEIGWGGVGCSGLVQDKNNWRALVSAVMNRGLPENAGKFLRGYTTGGLSSSAQFQN
jgi:hypothetical protein